MHTHDDARRRDEHDVVAVGHQFQIDERARLFVENARLDALTRSALQTVFLHVGALAVTERRDREHVLALIDDQHIHQGIVRGEVHRPHALRVAPHCPHVRFGETDTLARAGSDDEFILARRTHDRNQGVALDHSDGNLTVTVDAHKLLDGGLFDEAVLGGKGDEFFPAFLYGEHADDLFVLFDLHDVDERAAAGSLCRFGDHIALDVIYLALIREQQNMIVRGADEHILHKVLFLGFMSRDADAAAVLRLVFGDGQTLGIAAVREGNDNVLHGNEVLVLDVAFARGYFRFTGRRIAVFDVREVIFNDFQHAAFARKNIFEVGDGVVQSVEFVLQFFHFQRGQTLQAHFKDGVRLFFVQFECRAKTSVGVVFVGGFLDDFHHFVHVGKREHEPFHDVRALFRFVEIETGAAHDDFFLMVDVFGQNFPKVEHFGFGALAHERQKVDAVRNLQVGVFIQGIQHDLRAGIFFDLDDDAHARAVGLFADVRNAFEPLVLDHIGDRLDERRLVDLIGNFRNDDARTGGVARLIFLDFALGTDDDAALSRAIGLADAASAHDDAARGKIGRGDIFHELVYADFGIVDHGDGTVNDLRKVVRRDIGRHAHGNAVRAVDEQVGIARRQNEGFFFRTVEVGQKVHRLLVEIAQHLRRQFGKTRFRITHCGGGISVHRAEIAVPVHEREIDGEILRQTHQRVVYGRVAVRVIFTEHVADDTRAFAVRFVVIQTHFAHGV